MKRHTHAPYTLHPNFACYNINRNQKCTRCGVVFVRNDHYRTTLDYSYKVCPKCIGFFLSRYSLTWDIQDPSKEELKWKKHYDRDWPRLIQEVTHTTAV
jgi:hypothetical protein